VIITSVAFVPAAPLLVPQVAGGSAAVDGELRAASIAVVADVIGTGPGDVVVVAATPTPGEWTQAATWDFAGFGVVRDPIDDRPRLPWSLGIGAWLLDEAGWAGPRRYLGVPGVPGVPGPDPADPAGPPAQRTAVIAVGDGSACRTEKAPGYLDRRAESFDARVADQLSRGDAAGLAATDQATAADLLCASVPVWRWVAAALGDAAVRDAHLVAHVAPYGVGYFVARWEID
jgi:hypothetical protein